MVRFVGFVSLLALTLLGGCKGSDRDVSNYLAQARQYTSEGNTAKARVELQNALKVNPANPQVSLALAKNEEASGNLQSAFSYYLRASQSEANLIEAQLRVSEMLLDSNRLQDAFGRVNATIGAFPNNADALALRADIQERQGQITAARTDSDAALKRDPINPRALSVSARLKLQAQDVQGALAIVKQGLAKFPDDLRLLQVAAAIQITLNQPDKAIDAFRAIVRAAPRNALAQRALADLEADNGRLDDALNNFKMAVSADPNNEELQLSFVTFLASRSKPEAAVAYLRTLIGAHPTESTYVLVLSEFYRNQGDTAESRIVLNDAIKRIGDGKTALDIKVALAKLDILLGQFSPAESQLQAVLAIDPRNNEALLVRAALALQNGRVQSAIDDLLAVVRTDPVNGRAFQTLAAAYMSRGDSALAIDAMQRAVAVSPGDDGAEVRLAVFLQGGGAGDRARELISRLTLRRPDAAVVWVTNARLAIDRKDWDTANRSLTRLRDLPDTAAQVEALDGQIKIACGDYAGAAQALRAVLDHPEQADPSVIGDFAKASVQAKQIEPGLAVLYRVAPALKGEAVQAVWSALMNMEADAGRFGKADEAFAKIMEIAPRSALPYAGYLRILVAQKAFDRARAMLNIGIAAGAPKGTLLLLRGTVDEGVGNFPAALATYREAVEENPSSIQAANNYASLLADQEPKNISALTELRHRLAGAENSSNFGIIDTIAWLDYRLGRLPEAKLFLNRISAATSTNPQIRFHLAAVLLALGEKTQGLALLDTVKGLTFPGSDEVRALSAT